MKMRYGLILLSIIGLLSCSKKDLLVSKEADFLVLDNNGKAIILNKSKGYTHCEIVMDGNSSVTTEVKDTLKIFTFGTNGSHNVSVGFYNAFDKQDTWRNIGKSFVINSIPPQFKFESSYLGKGKFQVINQSKYIGTPTYTLSMRCGFFYSKSDTLDFNFERNGKYVLSLPGNEQVDIEVKDLPTVEPNLQFSGEFLGDSKPPVSNKYNDFYCSYGSLAVTYQPIFNYATDKGGVIFLNNVSFGPGQFGEIPSAEEKYKYFKSILKLGKLSTKDWNVLFYKDQEFLKNQRYDNIPNASIEIIKVEERDQVKITPDMYQKSFEVTFLLDVDAPGYGIYKGELKTKLVMF